MKIGNIPIHIGVQELKQLVYVDLSAKFQKGLELDGLPPFSLGINDVELCNKNGVPIDMRLHKDMISDHFYKKDNKGNISLKNDPPPIVLQLRVSMSSLLMDTTS